MRLVVEADRDHSLAKADRAVWLYERILTNTPADDPYRLRRTAGAATAYLTRSVITGSADGLTTGLWYAHLAASQLPDGDPLFGPALALYASMIVHDQDLRGQVAELPQAIAAARRAAAVARAGRPEPGQDPEKDLLSPALDALDNAAQLWFEATGSRQFADLAVVAGVGALRHSGPRHPKRVALLSNLSRALTARTMVLPGPDADRARAIRLGEAAVRRCPPGHPERVLALTNLGMALLNAPPGWPVDYRRVVDLGRQVLDLTPTDHPQRPRRLANLASAAELYAEHGGGSPALDTAVDRATEACAAASDGVIRSQALSALGSALVTRYDWWAEPSDLDEALLRTAEAVDACPEGHRARWAYLSNYAVIAADRWNAYGDEHARDTALEVSTRLLAELPHWHRDRPAALAMHALRLKSVGRIDEAVELGEAAVRAAEEALPAADVGAAADLVIWLNNLVSIYRRRWYEGGDAAGLDRAVEVGERGTRVLARMPPEAASAVSAARLRYGLSLALRDRYRQRRGLDPDSWVGPERSVRTAPAAAAAEPPGDGVPADPAAERDAEAASDGWRQVLQDPTLPVDLLVSSAVELAGLHAGRGEPVAAADGYRVALDQLPRLSWRGRSRSGQEDALARWHLLGADAAAVAVDGGDPGAGVELLDQARGVLWGQLLDDRSAARRLRQAHPALADRLAAAAAGLDVAGAEPAAAGGRGGR
ncbi:hypothetical protein EDC02_2120 [Micromonospora sp. Llam0]|uniref:hypothetical protein n=1 Tax=Micromonospora sp. Llam0 TaxID=2485143 RepID=UPI000F486126|nr:hypothetical protein [Micromonospora sp. Llam0]ROO60261.1 hypothetical protein EDC02_2120 [Micromonospora sp. Llam0]